MARIRSIKPEFFTDEEIGKLGFAARLFFVGLWCHADKAGRLEDKPMQLAIQIIPYDMKKRGVSGANLLNELVPRFVIRYKADGKSLLQIRNFSKHQKPHHTERESNLPNPPSNGYLTVREPMEEGSVIGEGKGGGKGKVYTSPSGDGNHDGFDQFWETYPRKIGKEAARKAWKKLRPSPQMQSMIVIAVKTQCACDQWTRDGGQFIPHPTTWLNQGRWQDEVQGQAVAQAKAKTCESEHCSMLSVRPEGMRFPKDCEKCEAAIGAKQ